MAESNRERLAAGARRRLQSKGYTKTMLARQLWIMTLKKLRTRLRFSREEPWRRGTNNDIERFNHPCRVF